MLFVRPNGGQKRYSVKSGTEIIFQYVSCQALRYNFRYE